VLVHALCEIACYRTITTQLKHASAHQDEDSKVLLQRYVLNELLQIAKRMSSRGLIQWELQLANVYIIGILDADSKTKSKLWLGKPRELMLTKSPNVKSRESVLII